MSSPYLLFDLIAFGGHLVDKLDHGRSSALVNGIYNARAAHLQVLLAHFVVPEMNEQFVGQLVVQFEHVIQTVVHKLFVVFEYALKQMLANTHDQIDLIGRRG